MDNVKELKSEWFVTSCTVQGVTLNVLSMNIRKIYLCALACHACMAIIKDSSQSVNPNVFYADHARSTQADNACSDNACSNTCRICIRS